MKSKLLLLILSFSVVLFSCKKEKTPEDKLADAKQQVIGTWAVQSGSVTYYDAAGKVVKTEPADVDGGIQIQFVDATTVKTSDSPNDPYPYTLTNADGKIMLNVINVNYELKVNSNTMSWSLESEYTDNNDDHIVKGILTIQFKKV
nr:hypothetical protein [Mucilaginibacter sp. L294]